MQIFSLAVFLSALLALPFTPGAFAITREDSQVVTADGQRLSAVWTLPADSMKATALILQGSGNVGADGDVSGPFLGNPYQASSAKLSEQIAETLASVGIASLRYSKRGFDDATQLSNQKFPYLLTDAEDALKLLQSRFPDQKLTVVGFSEGGLIASLLASNHKIDGLYLLAPAIRPIDELFSYQFLVWPVELLKSQLKKNLSGNLTASSFSELSVNDLPLIGKPWTSIDFNQDEQISIVDELIPAYQGFYSAVRGLLSTPNYSGWYESFKTLPKFSEFAPFIKSSTIHVYQGMDDAQLRWSWVVEDLNFLPGKPTLHLYPHLAHCFAPMEGPLGEVKHSGPIANPVLNQLAVDFQSL